MAAFWSSSAYSSNGPFPDHSNLVSNGVTSVQVSHLYFPDRRHYLAKGHRPDCNNSLGGDSNSGHILAPGTYSNLAQLLALPRPFQFCVRWSYICSDLLLMQADDAYSIRSTCSCYWLVQFLTLALNILILSIFYISMDLSTNYFAHFSGC